MYDEIGLAIFYNKDEIFMHCNVLLSGKLQALWRFFPLLLEQVSGVVYLISMVVIVC